MGSLIKIIPPHECQAGWHKSPITTTPAIGPEDDNAPQETPAGMSASMLKIKNASAPLNVVAMGCHQVQIDQPKIII
jgi:hypothetical protein